MPYCKKCHSRLEKFNSDRCPICGEVNPFEGVSSETVEITSEVNEEIDNYKPRRRSTLLMLFITLGIFGVPFYYLYQVKTGIIYAIINLVGVGVIAFIFAFYIALPIFAAILIALGIFIAINLVMGIILKRMPNLKDGRGEFVI